MNAKCFLLLVILAGTVVAGDEGQPIEELTSVEFKGNGSVKVSPDPNSSWELLAALHTQKSLQRYLGIPEDERVAIEAACIRCREHEKAFFATRRGNTNPAEDLFEFRERVAKPYLDEVVTPEQLATLRKLAMRLEVVRIGLPDSLVRGQLGIKIGVYESQKLDLVRKATEIQTEASKQITEILKQAESDTLDLLSPEQRKKAEELIGDTIDLRELSDHESLYERANKIVAAEEEAKKS